jgi:hypothetical protein
VDDGTGIWFPDGNLAGFSGTPLSCFSFSGSDDVLGSEPEDGDVSAGAAEELVEGRPFTELSA